MIQKTVSVTKADFSRKNDIGIRFTRIFLFIGILCSVMLLNIAIVSAANATGISAVNASQPNQILPTITTILPVLHPVVVQTQIEPTVIPTQVQTTASDPLADLALQIRQRPANEILEQQFVARGIMRMRSITSQQREEAAALAALAGLKVANPANPGTDKVTSRLGIPVPGGVPDYFGSSPNYANSPLPTVNPTTGAISGGMRKFVDSLPGMGAANANNLSKYIPVAVADTTTYNGTDYYEIGLVQYTEKMHTDLPATTLRGYVQISTAKVPGSHIQLFYPNGTPIRNATGSLVYAVDNPHYLGPMVIAQKDRPVRVKFTNYIAPGRNGDLFIPVDTTIMGAGKGPDGVTNYSQNRATLHLHGGNTPWISDGTPNQWTTPVGESTPYPKGVSVANVPDMDNGNEPAGTLTFYYTNQQSARLMWYHDHAYGITRLNVYAGEAAAYLLQDTAEAAMVTAGTIPATQIPLVIQDKVFVPSAAQLATQDPTWNWGTTPGTAHTGDLWFPHVYMPNQNPESVDGANPMGRWDYGPWFWPPVSPTHGTVPNPYYNPITAPWEPTVIPGTPNPSLVPEAFVDTPLVNGNAYPFLQVGEKAYRFRILNAANDRTLNLQLYYASTPGPFIIFTGGSGSGASASATVSTVGVITNISVTGGGAGYNFTTPPTVKIFDSPQHTPAGSGATATAIIDNATGTVFSVTVTAGGSGYAVPTVCRGPGAPVSSTCTEVSMVPACTSCGNLNYPANWPAADARDGGWPSPNTVGPSMIQIGTEGGFLPAPVVIPNRPIGYEYNRRSITVLNVLEKALFLGPAERADVIVDFSGVPAGSTLMLYNDAPAPVPAFDPRNDYYTGDPDQTSTGGAPSTLPGYGPNTRTVMQIQVNASLGISPTYNLAALQAALPAAYAQFQAPPIVPQASYNTPFNANYPIDAYARIQSTSMTFIPAGTVTPITMALQPKAIHELFTLDYGRMNALLGMEVPFTNFNTQTTIPYGYVDPPTEIFNMTTIGTPLGSTADGTQIWKITHNGVDTHAIHFHMFNVQLINRIGWDGAVKPPADNEIGWKETVIMNPLEDVVVAMRPIKPNIPWDLPNSIRLLDPTTPAGTAMPNQFSNVDPTNQPVTIVNHLVNYGWEYVWHCHLLGHEENDMMRAMAMASTPVAPSNLTARGVGTISAPKVNLTWTDNSVSETNWTVQRATSVAGPWGTSIIIPSTTGPQKGVNVTYSDATILANATYYYRIMATNIIGDTTIYPAPAVGFPYMTVNSTPSNTAISPPSSRITTIGTVRNGVFLLRNSNTAGNADLTFAYGNTGDTPVTGDWNADGVTTIGTRRNGIFNLRNSNSAGTADITFTFGNPTDIPVTGDWNGDGITTIGTYRNGTFFLRNSNSAGPADLTFNFGNPTDKPITGDWNGDGVTTIGTVRNGVFLLRNTNSAGNADTTFAFGNTGDAPVTGDWNGDGVTTIGSYRNGVFLLRNTNSAGNADLTFAFGTSGSIPITGKWV